MIKHKMRIAIVGSRNWEQWFLISDFIETLPPDTVIISGGAKGADSIAEKWAHEYGLTTEIYLPDWDKYGKSAGFLRNTEIVAHADMVVAFWDGQSKGTLNTIEQALKADHIKEIRIIRAWKGFDGG